MTFQTERHAEWLGVIDFVHLINAAVAFDAAQTAIHMDGMIEVSEVRELVDLNPLNRLATRRTLPHQRQPRIVFEHLVVTIHAGGRGRDIGKPGFLDARMAISAINAHLPGVGRVRECHRLNRLVTNPSVLRREVIPDARRYSGADQQPADDDIQRQPVGPFWENR